MRASAPALVVMVVVGLSACSEDPQTACVPGRSEACTGAGGCAGAQVCSESGAAFGPCVCTSTPPDSGTPVDGGGEDAGTDGGTGTCNPLSAPGQQGCGAGQKCTWIVVADTPEQLGRLGCVPDGTAALGAACSQGPVGETTGYDNCVAGAICVDSVCKDVCGFDGSPDAACGPGERCTRYTGLFSNGADDPVAGACTPTCNPVTQTFADGGTCGPNQGCYLLVSTTDTIAVCAGAGTVQHNQATTGTVYANTCVPGHQPRRRDGTSQTIECGALCAPANVTATTNQSSEAGVGPYDCPTMSASSPTPAAAPGDPTAGESCRYWWAREPTDRNTSFSNTVGWCFKHAAFQYDSNGDTMPDAPFPRCTTLTTGDVVPPIENPPGNDALYFWCLERPEGQGVLGTSVPPRARGEILLDRLGGWRD